MAPGREDVFPLRKDFPSAGLPDAANGPHPDNYPFVRVEGEGVHEIPVGPVHAGTIEPGHFRFSVVGEGVLRLEERLGYKHKGIEKRFESLTLAQGARLAGRISGDSTVAYAWAYAMAVECAAAMTPPARALCLRALLLERERIGNHLWRPRISRQRCGACVRARAVLAAAGKTGCARTHALFGHRYLMDTIVPGGVACDVDEDGIALARARRSSRVGRRWHGFADIYDEHAGLQDRFIGCGRVAPELAEALGLTGLAGRASAVAWDLRVQFPPVPYEQLRRAHGDASQRRRRRARDRALRRDRGIAAADRASSSRICRRATCVRPVPDVPDYAVGIGWVEGWRGEVLIALEAAATHAAARVIPHDPSWQNWPLLERAVLGNIVPDFPLINKSFNLSYSGHDLVRECQGSHDRQ